MRFKYRARDEDGDVVEGHVEAASQMLALGSLRQDGLVVLALSAEARRGRAPWGGRTVPAKARMVFFRQLAAMSRAGVGLLSAMDILIEQEESRIFKDVLLDVRDDLNRGLPLSQAMRQRPAFDPLTVSMVQAGEEGGVMDDVLDRVAALLEKRAELRGRIRGALLYPAFVALFAVAVLAVFLTLILPQFKQVFEAMNIELPGLTRFMCSAGDVFAGHWRAILAAVLLCVLAALVLSRQPLMDRVKLRLPLFGSLILRSSLARGSHTLAALTAAGVSILQSLEMAADTAGNRLVREGFLVLREKISQGVSLGDASRQARIFPALVSQMMRIGEETGRLDNMMERVASWYDQELDVQIKALTSLLGPAAIILVGGVVALIALSVFSPILSAMSEIR